MADKRKRKPKTRREDLSRPSTWRRQHGEFGPPSFDTDPDTGAVVTHHRAIDTPGQMPSDGTIMRAIHQDPDATGCPLATDISNVASRAPVENFGLSPRTRAA